MVIQVLSRSDLIDMPAALPQFKVDNTKALLEPGLGCNDSGSRQLCSDKIVPCIRHNIIAVAPRLPEVLHKVINV